MGFKLTDLIDVAVLQKIQNAFSKMSGMAALTTEVDGTPITEGTGFTDYCMKYTRNNKTGCERCRKCDCNGMDTAIKTGRATIYHCHAGLIDFAAPITINGDVVGCFIGGQVLTEKPDREEVKKLACELGIDECEYYNAALDVPVLPEDRIKSAADFLYTISGILSDIAYSKYVTLNANKEIERASNMKSDFLASMSHEIRTPMNAVLGMTEMALREDLPPAARKYITQIKSSGKILLNIINDVLDFSKIESGKMDIIPVEYEILSLCDDVSNIVETRLKDKRVELLLSINPDIPCKLYGDSIRVRQILINLANNAVKFTKRGKIDISIDYEPLDAENISMKLSVSDTGCGIKPEDIEKIFDSFQQVDSKRNRGAEGTGLGLAICKKLLNVMDGDITVSSVYEKGSTFSVTLSQRVVDFSPAIKVDNADDIVAIGYFRNKYLARQFFADIKALGVLSIAMISPDRIKWGLKAYEKECKGKKLFVFTDEKDVDEEFIEALETYSDMQIVELVDYYSDKEPGLDNWHVIKRPLSANAIAMVLNGETIRINSSGESDEDIDFIAPDAKVLIVDDNAINLTVTEGLLEPLHMKVYAITSGIEAIDIIDKHHFDLIFMDHMMPELDGIETTRIIRRFHPQYNNVPIIALTANAMDGMKEVFLSEGMNDFVAKPIEVRTLIQKVKQWLPPELIVKSRTVEKAVKDKLHDTNHIIVGNLDTDSARKLLGSDDLFWKVLKEYYRVIPAKSKLIGQLKQQGNIEQYTIEVHALKSSSRQIGATALANLAAELEKAGHTGDMETIRECTDDMLRMYTDYIQVLEPFCIEKKDTSAKLPVVSEEITALFDEMSDAVVCLDIDRMEEVSAKLGRYDFGGVSADIYMELSEAVNNIDVDLCSELIDRWRNII